MSSGNHLSKEFFELVKSIGESRSKQEEDKIISAEVRNLKAKMAAPDVASKKMKEYLIRMIYVEMLGHDASFGHIHAIKMVHRPRLLEKRCGYLAVSLCLHSAHNFMLLLINSLQTDLRSDNFLEVSMALTAVCKLVNRETIPALLPLVIKLLEHKQPNIRKKAVLALTRFHQIEPSAVMAHGDKVRKVLCDKDPAVMGASLCLLYDLALGAPSAYKDLVPSFVSILKQVTEHRLPRDYDYHRMPAPWIQLKLLQILAVLGANDRAASEGMYEVLHEVMKRADIGINVGYAIVYECVRTVTAIYPDNALIEDASLSIARFITSDNHNLKYLGVNSLAAIVQINPKYAAEHQLTVIDCLEDPDETLKRKTLDLLYSMTNPQNVVVIVEKLTNFLRLTTDVYLRTELVGRINQLAEKYAPNSQWYITTLNSIFELGGDLVRPEVAHSLMRLIAESAAQEGTAQDVRQYAVDTYYELLCTKKQLSDVLLQVIAWVLGEFGHLPTQRAHTRADIVARLIHTMDGGRHFDQTTTRSWLLSAIMKLAAGSSASAPGGASAQQPIPKEVKDLVTRYQSSVHVDLQQRSHEFAELFKAPRTMAAVLPLDAAADAIQIDPNLPFLSAYVDSALKAGAQPYQSREKREAVEAEREAKRSTEKGKTDKKEKSLSFTPYAAPQSQAAQVAAVLSPSAKPDEPPAPARIALSPNAPKRWGADMFDEKKTAAPASNGGNSAPSTAAPAATASADPYPSAAPASGPAHTPQPAYSEPAQPKRAPKPVQLTEREIRARELGAQLFAGIIPGTTPAPAPAPVATAPPVRTAYASPAPAPVPQQQPVQQPPKSVDLFGVFEATPAAAAPKPTANTGLEGLFDLSAVKAAPAPATVSGTGNLFGLPTQQPAKAVDPLAAAFGGGGGSSSSSGTFDIFGDSKAAPSSSSASGSAAMSAAMTQRLAGLPRTPAAGSPDLPLASNAALTVTYVKANAAEKAIVALFLTASSSGLSDVTVQLDLPSGISVNYDGDPLPQGKGTAFVVPKIAPGATATALVYLSAVNSACATKLKDASSAASAIGVALTYPGSGQGLRGAVGLQLSDLLRPSPMTTDKFGGHWKAFANEKKWAIAKPAVTTAADFVTRARSALGIYHVQTINSENICAGKLIAPATQDNTICLVHGRLKGIGTPAVSLEMTVRTQSADYTAVVAALANAVFSA